MREREREREREKDQYIENTREKDEDVEKNYQMREPGPYFLGCEFHTASCPIIASCFKMGGWGGWGGRFEKGKQRFPEAFLGNKNDKSGGGRMASQKLQKQQGDGGSEGAREGERVL